MTASLPRLEAPNAEAARGFYAGVLDCVAHERPHATAPEPTTEVALAFACVRDGVELALVVQAPQSVVVAEGPAVWSSAEGPGVPALAVDDVEAATGRALALGAVRVEGDATTLRDPQGATFRLVAG